MGTSEEQRTKPIEQLRLLRNPYTGNTVVRDDDVLIDSGSGERFPIRDGIPVLLREDDVAGINRRMQWTFDLQSYVYDLSRTRILSGLEAGRSEYSEQLDVNPGDRVLESCVGTGLQLRNLQENGKEADYFGVDISYGMLKKCRKNARKWGMNVGLVQGNAEQLPYADDTFDVVFEFGGILFVPEKVETTLQEMTRVTKPGGQVAFVTPTAKLLDLNLFVKTGLKWFGIPSEPGPWGTPLEIVPDIATNTFQKEIWNGKLSVISFQKPDEGVIE
ncbi:methyltransferase domain-containing protein [Halobacteria archaeon AArc-curdl1]|uniref:Methyltransferase domain-containing protein n=1 Tax=Natronosalvus hydrolyticus TaxID=2979988 RepID=A0AAP2Z9D1_9EURY|nr:methyltransferase domain-containing protein [Halobacteria archaeon AArc-curdl1]